MRHIVILISFVTVFIISGTSHAYFANPDPTNLLDDSGVSEFNANQFIITAKLLDIPNLNGIATSYGFYYHSNPSSLITVFGTQDLIPSVGDPPQATISPSLGVMITPSNPSPTAIPSSTDSIGFFLTLDPDNANVTLYSDPALNPGGVDLVGAFQSVYDPSVFLIQFYLSPDGDAISRELVIGAHPTPEPATLILLGGGVGVLCLFRRYRKG